MTTWTEAQIDRHLHLWEHRHGPDSPEAGIVRQLRAERDAARLAGLRSAHRICMKNAHFIWREGLKFFYIKSTASDEIHERMTRLMSPAALPTTQETPHD